MVHGTTRDNTKHWTDSGTGAIFAGWKVRRGNGITRLYCIMDSDLSKTS
jgi:hypothetical protein